MASFPRAGEGGAYPGSLMVYGTRTQQGDRLIYSYSTSLRRPVLAWIFLVVGAAGTIAFISLPFQGGPKAYRCDPGAGACTEVADLARCSR